MSLSNAPLSLRLPIETRNKLDEIAKLTRRSRSFIMQEAIDVYLEHVTKAESKPSLKGLLALAGSGKESNLKRTAEDVENYMQWLRGNE